MNIDPIPSKDRPIIVLSSGRSGSTLLQKLLNTNPGITIWGEHAGFLTSIMDATNAIQLSKWIHQSGRSGSWLMETPRKVDPEAWTAWDGSFSKADFLLALKLFLDQLFCATVPDDMRWGFKEIRYHDLQFMNFFSGLYPNAQFIILMRDPVASCVSFTTAISERASRNPVDYLETMEKVVSEKIRPAFQFFRDAELSEPSRTITITYESLITNPEKTLNRIEKFLDLGKEFQSGNISRIIGADIVSERKRVDTQLRNELVAAANKRLIDEIKWYRLISKKHSI